MTMEQKIEDLCTMFPNIDRPRLEAYFNAMVEYFEKLQSRTMTPEEMMTCPVPIDEVDPKVLRTLSDLIKKKLNYHCTKYPERNGCKDCPEDENCDRSYITWNCDHDLRSFKEGLAEQSIKDPTPYVIWTYFNGGFCDCEFYMNAVDRIPE